MFNIEYKIKIILSCIKKYTNDKKIQNKRFVSSDDNYLEIRTKKEIQERTHIDLWFFLNLDSLCVRPIH